MKPEVIVGTKTYQEFVETLGRMLNLPQSCEVVVGVNLIRPLGNRAASVDI